MFTTFDGFRNADGKQMFESKKNRKETENMAISANTLILYVDLIHPTRITELNFWRIDF